MRRSLEVGRGGNRGHLTAILFSSRKGVVVYDTANPKSGKEFLFENQGSVGFIGLLDKGQFADVAKEAEKMTYRFHRCQVYLQEFPAILDGLNR